MNLQPNDKKKGIYLTPFWMAIIIAVNILMLIILWIFGSSNPKTEPAADPIISESHSPYPTTISPESLQTLVPTVTVNPTATIRPTHASSVLKGIVVMSLNIDGYANLFAYDLEESGYVRLTNGMWDDIHPSISPDGSQVVFSSNRRGFWDIYILGLDDGEIRPVTLDENYDGHPTWSPDGAWIAYETYLEDNLEIAFTLAVSMVAPIRITDNPTSEHSPIWAPNGRVVAFVSDLGGSWDIWRVDLDETTEDRMQNLTNNPTIDQTNPNWSADGKFISWASVEDGVQSVYFAEDKSDIYPIYSIQGEHLIWGPGSEQVLIPYFVPETYYLAFYETGRFRHMILPIKLPGQLEGIDWGINRLRRPLPTSFTMVEIDEFAEGLAGQQASADGAIFGRQLTIPLVDVEAPHAELSALAVEPFFALRDRVMREAGWDVLSSLEYAFVPITQPLEPGRSQDWLYTGRAFSLARAYLDVGWMIVAKEEFAGKVYWRVYVRAMKQDGSQGRPLRQKPWDFNARFSTNTTYYEQGGAPFEGVPKGYWVDFTRLAQAFGWERLPALSSWEYYFHAARFNEFVITSGLTWEEAMLQLYPPEILETPSPVSR